MLVSRGFDQVDTYALKAQIASLMMAKTLGTEVEAIIDDNCRLVAISFL